MADGFHGDADAAARLHPAARAMLTDARRGGPSRRTFLTLSTALGASAALARRALGETLSPAPEAAAQEAPTPGGELRVAMAVKPMRDPRLFDWSEQGNVARQVCEPLTRYEADLTLRPWLLEGWEVSPDARTYTLRLRRGVRWSDGAPFTAQDVLYNLRRWCEAGVPGNSMAARFAALIDPDVGRMREGAAEALDAHTVRLTLTRPDITLIAGMADYPALIVRAGFDEVAGGGDISVDPVGTGPFRLVEFAPGARARLIRSPTPWWGGPVWLDAVTFLDLGTDPAAQRAAFAAGAVDVNYETPVEALGAMESLGLKRHWALTGDTVVARLNARYPPYDDVRVRRAVQRAVDNAVVLQLGHEGAGIPADNHHVGPMHPDHAPLPAQPRDPAETRALIAAAGQAEHLFELVSIDDVWRRNTADAIAAQMQDAGLRVTRAIVPPTEFWARWRDYPFSTTNWNMRPLGVQVLTLAYRSDAAWNETGYANPEFDALLDAALGEPDLGARIALMATLEGLLQDDGVIVQPYWRAIFAHSAPRVRGYRRHQAFETHLEEVWLAPA
jgi:peptide/nickel transport system substrate-binding protein